MRLSNMLYFTENHRFCIYRDFSLSGMDYRMLGSMYQPMVGAFAAAVYLTLYQQLPSERAGFSTLEQQRKLFLALELEPGERGRKYFAEQASKLEAVGLMQTTRRYIPESDESIYEYRLQQPLGPGEFFKNQHLTLLLRDKVGKYAVLSLRDELFGDEPQELLTAESENLSVPFYDIFRLNTQVIDYELEQALFQTAPARQSADGPDVAAKSFDYAEIIQRIPRGSRNREFLERLRYRQDQLIAINMVAKKYGLTLQETCRLLDEDAVFDEDGTLQMDAMQHIAHALFRQDKKRGEERERLLRKTAAGDGAEAGDDELQEEKTVEQEFYLEVPPIFQGQCNIHQYNLMLRNEPYTKVLDRFFPKGAVPDGLLDIFAKVDLTYGLPEEVINVLIHYVHVERRSWAQKSIEAAATDLLGKQIATYEQAVGYVRERAKYREQKVAGLPERERQGKPAARTDTRSARTTGGRQKPVIPEAVGRSNVAPLTQDELEHILSLARKLQNDGAKS